MVTDIVTVCVMAEAPEPEVAVTTTVLVPELAYGLLPAPHPIAIPPIPSSSTRQKNAANRFFLPKKSRPNATVIPLPANGHWLVLDEGDGIPSLRDVSCVVAMVMVAWLAVVPFRVTLDGEKLHVELTGRPEQEKDTD
jgi:hypothetical protein